MRIAMAVLIGWQVISGALQHPDYLAYTNEIAGAHPEHFVADSDLDWGQDMKRLGSFLQHAGVAQVTFSPFNRTYALPVAVTAANPDAPSPGWNAASVTLWKVFGFPAWVDRMPPPHRIGRSILVWYVQPGAAQDFRFQRLNVRPLPLSQVKSDGRGAPAAPMQKTASSPSQRKSPSESDPLPFPDRFR
jgi:hypothetical protein